MKALILAAGETGKGPEGEDYGFPKNYKPKCLLRYEDEVILERDVKLLRKHGIKDIICGLCKYLQRHGSKEVEGEITEVDNFADVEKWESWLR